MWASFSKWPVVTGSGNNLEGEGVVDIVCRGSISTVNRGRRLIRTQFCAF
jgi:hypothetical protein